jgi:hypothetical protein
MKDSISTERAPAKASTCVAFILIAIITLLHSLKDKTVTTARGLTEVCAAIRVELISIIASLNPFTNDSISTYCG